MGWNAKRTDGYETSSTQATENANEIYAILANLGYSLKAISAILGNIWKESGYNPWQWQDNRILTTGNYRDYDNRYVGYGLVQWTPSKEYIDDVNAQSYSGYAPNFYNQAGNETDGSAQTYFIDYQLFHNGNWFWNTSRYNYYNPYFYDYTGKNTDDFTSMTAQQFKDGASGDGTHIWVLEDFVGAFSLEYLRPGYQYAARDYWPSVSTAEYWYQYFEGQPIPPPPDPPPPHPPIPKKGMPVWMMIDYRF